MLIVIFALGAFAGCGKQPERLNWGRNKDSEEEFARMHYSGGVFLDEEFNIDDIAIPIDDVHTLSGRDETPAIIDPELIPATEAAWLPDSDRVAVAKVGDKVVGTSIRMMSSRAIANVSVNDDHVAITYCPLCDSVTVFSRVIEETEGPRVIEFGTTGAFYNSNFLMYDREELGIWTQVNMTAVSGANVGKHLPPRPVEVLSKDQFLSTYPDAFIINVSGREPMDFDETASYFAEKELMLPVRTYSDALPAKTLGMGIATQEKSWFVPRETIEESVTVQTDAGEVVIESGEGYFRVASAPEGVRTAQTFFVAWSATFPEMELVEVE